MSFDFTSKPRGLDLSKNGDESSHSSRWIKSRWAAFTFPNSVQSLWLKLACGTYVENGDLMVAKITPSFENGKQAIVDIQTGLRLFNNGSNPLSTVGKGNLIRFLILVLLSATS